MLYSKRMYLFNPANVETRLPSKDNASDEMSSKQSPNNALHLLNDSNCAKKTSA